MAELVDLLTLAGHGADVQMSRGGDRRAGQSKAQRSSLARTVVVALFAGSLPYATMRNAWLGDRELLAASVRFRIADDRRNHIY